VNSAVSEIGDEGTCVLSQFFNGHASELVVGVSNPGAHVLELAGDHSDAQSSDN
jgi:hypothetical protein